MFRKVIFLSFEDASMATVRDATFCDLRDLVDHITAPLCDRKDVLASLDHDHSNGPPGVVAASLFPELKCQLRFGPSRVISNNSQAVQRKSKAYECAALVMAN